MRLSSVDGQVQVAQGGDVLADHALVNTPLFEGTQISTGDDGRAEIQFEDGSVARIPLGQLADALTVLKGGRYGKSCSTGAWGTSNCRTQTRLTRCGCGSAAMW